MSTGRRTTLDEWFARTGETGRTLGDVYLGEALAEIDRLHGIEETVTEFLAERVEFVRTLRQCVDDNADYYRWQGHAEARRVLAQMLGWPVPCPAEDAAKSNTAQQDGCEPS